MKADNIWQGVLDSMPTDITKQHMVSMPFDIETSGKCEDFMQLLPDERKEFTRWVVREGYTTSSFPTTTEASELWKEKAGLSDYCQITVIAYGRWSNGYKVSALRLDDYDSEREMLEAFAEYLRNKKPRFWVAHNILFDAKIIARRMLLTGVKIPSALLNIIKVKSWSMQTIKGYAWDTMEMGKLLTLGFKGVSLSRLCAMLGVDTPKEDLDGSMVSRLWHKEEMRDRIVRYCCKDTEATAMCYHHLLKLYL